MTITDHAGAHSPLAAADGAQRPENRLRDPAAIVAEFMRAMGMPEDAHTARTPERVTKAWRARLAGYDEDPADHLQVTFPVDGEPGLVSVTGIQFASTCAHHLLPITGTATVAYRPRAGRGRVVGLSKLSRVFDGYARRLQVQEQLGAQTADALRDRLRPEGAVVVITAEHGCMTIRGVQQPGTVTTTVSTSGGWTTSSADVREVLAEHRASL